MSRESHNMPPQHLRCCASHCMRCRAFQGVFEPSPNLEPAKPYFQCARGPSADSLARGRGDGGRPYGF